MKTKKQKQKQFGRDWTDGDLKFPKQLTPEIIHSALFVYNAQSKEDTVTRVKYCAEQIGDKAMAYAMALLVLPTLMDNMQQSTEYKEWQQSRIKTLN
jgi:hypothetical protein